MSVQLHSPLSECDDAIYLVSGNPVAAGDMVQIATDIFGFALVGGAVDEPIAVITRAPIASVPMIVGITIISGTRIYFDPATNTFGTTGGGNYRLIGTLRETAKSGDTRIFVNFDGRLVL
jgi:hypothetical protein